MRQAIDMLSGVDADVAQFARLFEAFLRQMEAAAQTAAVGGRGVGGDRGSPAADVPRALRQLPRGAPSQAPSQAPSRAR